MADMLPYKSSGCGCGARSYGCACGSGYGASRFVPAQPAHYAAAQEGETEKRSLLLPLAVLAVLGGLVLRDLYR